MTRPALEVADVVRQYGAAYLARYGATLSPEQHRALRAIAVCRTAALGGHATQCDACGHLEITYNSCGNRHCPKCPGRAQAAWLAAREAELLDVPYVHVVFTLPHTLSPLALQNPRVMYNLLFQAVAETLLTVARDPHHLGAEIGCLAVLHTWGQTLHHHPHLHCVVPGGGLSLDGTQWRACRPTFFLPVRVLSRVFRQRFLTPLRTTEWVVYAKPPVGGPGPVLKYLARYTHRVAITNRRLLALEEGRVTFRWKDYAHGNRQRLMTLDAVEFIRRFLLHILPAGFQRLRHYGLLANRGRQAKLERCRVLLQPPVSPPPSVSPDATAAPAPDQPAPVCPACQHGRMCWVQTLRRQPDLCARWMQPPGWDTS
jgi:putative transposase/transposase-like zinc-binding protein